MIVWLEELKGRYVLEHRYIVDELVACGRASSSW